MTGYSGKTLGVAEAFQAASEAASAFNLGACAHMSSSSAHCFSTRDAFIRVSPIDRDPSETLEVASFLALNGLGPAVISEAPFLVGGAAVELYEFIPDTHKQEMSTKELAEAMARLHGIDVENADLPFERRVSAARRALDSSPAHAELVQELREELDALEALVATSTADLVLCHSDLHAGNILKSHGDLKLVDLEFAGLATPTFDVAITFRSLQRHSSRADARDFLNHYMSISQARVDMSEVFLLGRARDIFGVCAMLPYLEESTPRGESARLRASTWKEAIKCTPWPLS